MSTLRSFCSPARRLARRSKRGNTSTGTLAVGRDAESDVMTPYFAACDVVAYAVDFAGTAHFVCAAALACAAPVPDLASHLLLALVPVAVDMSH
jgi:hypothetical protein